MIEFTLLSNKMKRWSELMSTYDDATLNFAEENFGARNLFTKPLKLVQKVLDEAEPEEESDD
jgi:hypothetical protein